MPRCSACHRVWFDGFSGSWAGFFAEEAPAAAPRLLIRVRYDVDGQKGQLLISHTLSSRAPTPCNLETVK